MKCRMCIRLADGMQYYSDYKDTDYKTFLDDEILPRWREVAYFKLEVVQSDDFAGYAHPQTMTFFPPNIAAVWVEEKEDREDF